jgi:hypothetical protein
MTTNINREGGTVEAEQAQGGLGLENLAFFEGRWRGTGTFFAMPWTAEKPIEMTIEVTRELGGGWYLTHTAERGGVENPHPLSALYLWGYDAAAGHYVAYWFDSNGGRAEQTSTGWVDDTLVFLGVMRAGGMTFPLRDTFVRKGPDSYYHLGEVELDGQWAAVDEEELRRQG